MGNHIQGAVHGSGRVLQADEVTGDIHLTVAPPLYADLGGLSGSDPEGGSHILQGWLRALHVSVPTGLPNRSAVFRSYTYGRRIGVPVNNAASDTQVHTLSPGHGPHLRVVTSRQTLAALRVHSADLVPLDAPAPRASLPAVPVNGILEFLSAIEVAHMYSVNINTLRRWRLSGKFLARHTPGGHRRYFNTQVLSLLRHR